MKLLLIRHGETVDNVKSLLAGVTDSALTSHGVLQTKRLGKSLADRGLLFTHIYSSDLSRARLTANAIREHQPVPELSKQMQFEALREQDFGSYECLHWTVTNPTHLADGRPFPSLDDPEFKPRESLESMVNRTGRFLDDQILPLLRNPAEMNSAVAVVAHGLILSYVWRGLLQRFPPQSVSLAPSILPTSRTLEDLPAWSNTGYLEVEILMVDPPIPDELANKGPSGCHATDVIHGRLMIVQAVNSKDHLVGLIRTRGGIGSSAHDIRQMTLEGFFQK